MPHKREEPVPKKLRKNVNRKQTWHSCSLGFLDVNNLPRCVLCNKIFSNSIMAHNITWWFYVVKLLHHFGTNNSVFGKKKGIGYLNVGTMSCLKVKSCVLRFFKRQMVKPGASGRRNDHSARPKAARRGGGRGTKPEQPASQAACCVKSQEKRSHCDAAFWWDRRWGSWRDFLILYNKRRQHVRELHNSLNQYLPNRQYTALRNHGWAIASKDETGQRRCLTWRGQNGHWRDLGPRTARGL